MFKMTPTILKNFLTEKATRLYPYEVREPYAHARGEIANNIETCNFCGICAAKCPSQCIKVDKKTATWACEPFECVYCGICVDACPKDSLTQKELYRKPSTQIQHVLIKGETRPEKRRKRKNRINNLQSYIHPRHHTMDFIVREFVELNDIGG